MYTHRNGESEPPRIDGEFWFDGALLVSGHYYNWGYKIRDRVDVKQDQFYWYWHGDYDCFAVWQVAGRWWGPIVPPWESE